MLFSHRFAWIIDNPVRRWLVRPETLFDRLEIDDREHILEVGPGSGYFSIELAPRLRSGALHLVDVQPEMLAAVARRLERAPVSIATFICGDVVRLPFKPASFDAVLAVAVLGESDSIQESLRSVFRVLKAGGRLLVHEHLPDPDIVRFGTLYEAAAEEGFVLERRWGRRWNYSALFTRPA